MNTISAEIVERNWKELSDFNQKEATNVINEISLKQPLILAYLMAIGEELFDQDENELLLYLGVAIWKMMTEGDEPMPEVTEELLDKKEEKNFKMIEYLGGESESGFVEGVHRIFKGYNQPEILGFVIEALMESLEEGIIEDENVGLMMLYLKTVIDCFDS